MLDSVSPAGPAAALDTALAGATGWDDLHQRLFARGLELKEGSGGLALHALPAGHRLCLVPSVSVPGLTHRFGAPPPGPRPYRSTWAVYRRG